MKIHRYPGVQPFEPEQKDIFFGREPDTDALYRLIRLRPIVVLFGKSGAGKSSLLNAGIIPRAEAESYFVPLRVRFKACSKDSNPATNVPPLLTTQRTVHSSEVLPNTFLDELAPRYDSLWHDVKTHQIRHSGERGLLLIFDQFEELFTYDEDAVLTLRRELAEALFTDVPQRYWDALRVRSSAGHAPLSEAQMELLQQPPQLRVVLSIRADRVHLLSRLDDYLPNILKNNYELGALNPNAAELAITAPAAAEGDHFLAAPFTYDRDSVAHVIDFLTDSGREKIETTQLQIVCRSIEQTVLNDSLRCVRREDIGDLEAIIANFYEDCITALPAAERLPARKLIEESLVFEEEERRLSLYEGQVLKQVSFDTLRHLTDRHLLRAEPGLQGGYTYELNHDTLVVPVLKAKNQRIEAENKEAERHRAAERKRELAIERNKRRIAQLVSVVAIIFALVALVAFGYAQHQSSEAEKSAKAERESAIKAQLANEETLKQAQVAQGALHEAGYSAELAMEKTKIAEDALTKADENLKKAKEEERRVIVALEELERQKSVTDEEKRKAKESLELVQLKTKEAEAAVSRADSMLVELKKVLLDRVHSTLQDAQGMISNMDYENAVIKIQSISALETAQRDVSDALLEIVFWYAETGRFDRAQGLLDTASSLLNMDLPSMRYSGMPDLKGCRKAMHALSPARLAFLDARYFPTMITINEGTYTMSNGVQGYMVDIASFSIAQTETTWWQYNLFCEATRREKPKKSLDWGFQGDNPIVNVSWYDAVDYANWLSVRKNIEKAIAVVPSPDHGKISQFSLKLGSAGYRLPTEAEWEYAARAGKEYSYSGSDSPDEVAWYEINSSGHSRPVSSKKSNDWGLYDMSGNVWEWCWDWYGIYPSVTQHNPVGPMSGLERVLRGGSYSDDQKYLGAAYRYYLNPLSTEYFIGFRLVHSAGF